MQAFVHDQYAPLNHRTGMGDGENRPPNVPGWIPDEDARRFAAYHLLAAYLDNVTRYYLPDALWARPTVRLLDHPEQAQVEAGKSPAEKYREYGDPRLLVEQAVALLLGDTQEVVVPDAVELPKDAKDEERAAVAVAEKFRDYLEQWAEDERLLIRLQEFEEDAVGLGDGVLVLGWDSEAGRPRLRRYDVESYFPVLSGDQDIDEFPNKVHFAWVEKTTGGDEILHRITYDRRQLPDGLTRRYRYAPDVASRWTVYLTHATWPLKNLRSDGLYDLSESAARYVTARDGTVMRDLDIELDFLPVVHEPNTPSGGRHFGRSLLLSVAQLLDDLGFGDSDLAASSELIGNAPVVVTGAAASGGLARGPGAEWNIPAGGDARILDTSNVLKGQIGYLEFLLSRLSVNTRLAEALLGRVKPNEVPSGYALGLGFAPTRSLIAKMRLVRSEKHPLILKFAARLAQQNGELPEGATPRAEIALGPYLPADVASDVERVRSLLAAKAISRRTGVQMLISSGLPIDDAEAEVERIKSESFEDAVRLLEATGDEAAVRRFLGLEGDGPPAPDAPAED